MQNPPAAPVIERVEGANLRVTFINHATVLIQTHGLNILTDPVWSKRVSPTRHAGPARVRAPGLEMSDLPPIDVMLVSHNHYDHMDVISLRSLWNQHRPHILAPLANGRIIRGPHNIDVTELDWGDKQVLGNNISTTLVPAQHWSSRGLFDAYQALWGGFVLQTPAGNIYFAGDTGYANGDHFRQAQSLFGEFRLALLPIGAYEPRWFMAYQHMNPMEAVRAHVDLNAHHSLGIHFGTFQLTDEGHDEPVKDLAVARAELGISADVFRTLENGQAWDVPWCNTSLSHSLPHRTLQ